MNSGELYFIVAWSLFLLGLEGRASFTVRFLISQYFDQQLVVGGVVRNTMHVQLMIHGWGFLEKSLSPGICCHILGDVTRSMNLAPGSRRGSPILATESWSGVVPSKRNLAQ